ncbi:MAG: restriction endonuclease subunit S [archaeon]
MKKQKILLKEICNIRTGYQKRAVKGNKYKLLKLSNLLEDGTINLNEADLFGEKEIKPRYIIKKNEILFKAKSSQNTAGIYLDEEKNLVASGHFFIISLKKEYKEKINPGYLAWYLREEKAQKYFKKFAVGMAMSAVRKSDLEMLEIALPPLDIQNLIAETYELMLEEKQLMNLYIKNRSQQIQGLLKKFL